MTTRTILTAILQTLAIALAGTLAWHTAQWAQWTPAAATITIDLAMAAVALAVLATRTRTGPPPRGALPWKRIALLAAGAWLAGQSAALAFAAHDPAMAGRAQAADASPVLWLALTLAVAPVCEELVMRGALWVLVRPAGLAAATIVTSVVFAVLHGTLTHMASATVFGLVLALVRERRGLGACVGVHAGYNLASVVLAGLPVPGLLASVWVAAGLCVAVAVVAVAGLARAGRVGEVCGRDGEAVDGADRGMGRSFVGLDGLHAGDGDSRDRDPVNI